MPAIAAPDPAAIADAYLLPRALVVVAASFSGIMALGKLTERWPQNTRIAALVALDTAGQPTYAVLDILQSFTQVPIRVASDGDVIEPGHLYLATADCPMRVTPERVLQVRHGWFPWSVRQTTDRLFSSAASAYGASVIGMVLTGQPDDGREGLQAIAAAGGVTIRQAPDCGTGAADPRPANRGAPHYCVPIAQMPHLLTYLAGGGQPGPLVP